MSSKSIHHTSNKKFSDFRQLSKQHHQVEICDRVRTAQGKPGKPGKRDFFEKNQGKPGKLREFSNHFHNLWEKSGNFILSNISSFKSNQTNVLLTGTLTNPVTAF